MSKIVIVLSMLCLFHCTLPQQEVLKDAESFSSKEIDTYLTNTMQMHEVPGLAISVVKNGAILYQSYRGLASIEHQVPVTDSTLFWVYSTTKLVINTTVFQLIEQGKFTLEDSLGSFLEGLPATWEKLQIKHLLSHSSGLPDFIGFDSKLSNENMWELLLQQPLEFAAGSQHRYNQTNYWILAKIIEKVSGEPLKNLVIKNQFNGNPEGIAFSSNSQELIPNRMEKYSFDSERNAFVRVFSADKSRGWAGNGLSITLDKFTNWAINFQNGDIVTSQSKSTMWEPFPFSKQDYRFAHGWALYPVNGRDSFGFTGGGVSAVRFFPEEELAILVLSNGYRYFPVHNDIVETIAGMVSPNLKDENSLVLQITLNQFIENPNTDAEQICDLLLKSQNFENLEGLLNRLGYRLLNLGQFENAIMVFESNAKFYPESFNVFDSLAESYLYLDRFEDALRTYRKSLSLNPENQNAKNMIERIQDRMDSLSQ